MSFRITFFVLVILSVILHAAEDNEFALRSNGSLAVWLVAGPFPNGKPGSDHKENCLGYFRDYLKSAGGEARVNPVEGDKITFDNNTVSWKNSISGTDGLLNYIDIFSVDQQTPGVAYAFTKITSEHAQDVVFKIRSDDGVKIWLNSKLIHDYHIGRGIEDEEDYVSAHLKKGDNSLLVKVDQGNGGWALQLQIEKADVQPITGLKNKLTLLESIAGKIISADLSVNPAVIKSDSGLKNELSLKLVSGGLSDVRCTFKMEEWQTPVVINPGELAVGSHQFAVDVPQITKPGMISVELTAATDKKYINKELQNVKSWKVYLLPHSHVDIGYTHVQTYVEKYQWEHLENAIEYAKNTESHPPGSQFKWNTEGIWAVESYLKQASPEKQEQFYNAVRKGWIGLDGFYGNELTALCRPEELMRFLERGQRIGQKIGVPVEAAMISDVPGYTWSMVPVMAQNGIKYFSIGPNPGHRIGSTLKAWGDRPFYWISPSGEEKVLCWMSSRGYASFHTGLNLTENIRRINSTAIFDYLSELEAKDFPYDMTYLRYNIGSDNGPPDEKLAGFVKEWNSKYQSPELIIATTAEMFRDFESEYAGTIPSVKGDFTPYWEDGAASSALETSINRDNAERLVQAEKIWSMLDPENYPADEFLEAWRNVILYDEHTWGSWNSISEPEVDFTLQQWKIKQKFAQDAERQSKKLLQDALSKISQNKNTVKTMQVLNTNSWTRTDLVIIPADWDVPGTIIKDRNGEAVLSQKLSDGSIAILAKDIPPMGSVIYSIHKGNGGKIGKINTSKNSIQNEFIAVKIDPVSGSISSLKSIEGNHQFELTDHEKGNGLNEYFYIAGRDPSDPLPAANARIHIKEQGPLVNSIMIESDAPGCNKLTREISLVAGINRVDIFNTIDKKNIYDKEGVHFAFPFNVPDGETRIDIGWGNYRPEKDQLPGACKNYFTVQTWVDISNQDYGVTWVTNDAPMIEIGQITADPISYGWINHLQPSQKIYSYVMNNYWETNYKASQEGSVTFRYSMYPHGRFNSEEATRFGIERSQPLLVVPVKTDTRIIQSFIKIEPASIIITSVKPMNNGQTLLVRLYNSAGRPEFVNIKPGMFKSDNIYLSDPMGIRRFNLDREIEIPAYGIRTLILERADL
ncbi:MAG: hypothetical protein KDF60_10945 [Calditrichaeota bacterium]|nr:hypothetical protein [Calditrichota bacterium]